MKSLVIAATLIAILTVGAAPPAFAQLNSGGEQGADRESPIRTHRHMHRRHYMMHRNHHVS